MTDKITNKITKCLITRILKVLFLLHMSTTDEKFERTSVNGNQVPLSIKKKLCTVHLYIINLDEAK
jgi:hypothetical protein